MGKTAGDFLCQRLAWGVSTIDGFPGDAINGFLDAWWETLSADRPVIIDAMRDPEEPPMPPHVTFAQMEAMAKAFTAAPKEDLPGAISAVREFAYEFLPGR